MANIKKLKANGQDIVPITHEQAVLDSNGVTLESKLATINNTLSRLENNSTPSTPDTPSTPSLEGNIKILTIGNYTIKYNETDDTLDFIYNGATDVPEVPPTTEEIIPLTWAVGNLSSTDGSEKDQANSLRSSFAAIEDNYDYTFYMDTSFYDPSGVRVYFYDTNKTYISRTDGNVIGYVSGTDISIDVPSNAAYMRFKANASGTTSVDTIGSLFTLRKRKAGGYVTNGLSLYIDAQDAAAQGSIRDVTSKQNITNHGVSTTLDNGCLNFVASESDYIDCGFKPNLTQWSAEAYFYFTNMPTEPETVLGWGASGNRTAIAFWSTNFMIAITDNVEHTITSTVPTSLTHVILTYDNGKIIAYVNGIKSQITTSANTMTSQAGNLMIGTKYSASAEFGNIHLKSLRFYDNKVLTDEEASQNYNYELRRNSIVVKPTWIDDVYLDSSTGIQEDNVGTACSDFISYDNSYQYKITVDTVTYIRVLYYDSSKAFISKENVEDNSTDSVLTPPSNTAYIRLKVSKESIAFADLSQHVILKKILA